MKHITITLTLLLIFLFVSTEQALASSFYGNVNLPAYLSPFSAKCGGALITVFNMLLRLVIVVAGFYALWQFISAGYDFMTSSGDPQKVGEARNKIVFTIIGLLIIASALVLSGIIGLIFYGSYDAIINPSVVGVGNCT